MKQTVPEQFLTGPLDRVPSANRVERLHETGQHSVIDVERVRSLHPAGDRYSLPPCQYTGGDQIHHEAKAVTCLDAVTDA